VKTRDELLAIAEELVELARRHAQYAHEGNEADAAIASGIAATAQACVMLAKERREGERAAELNANVEAIAVWVGKMADRA
jgi:hypothetical protein